MARNEAWEAERAAWQAFKDAAKEEGYPSGGKGRGAVEPSPELRAIGAHWRAAYLAREAERVR